MPIRAIEVKGLKEFRTAVKQLENRKDVEDQLKQAHVQAARSVLSAATGHAATPLQRKALGAMSASPSQRGAAVRLGKLGGGAEFGAAHNLPRRMANGRTRRGWNQFPPWRGSGDEAGYFIWPTIRAETDRLLEVYMEALMRIIKNAFPDG